jgi:hypothetical protein
MFLILISIGSPKEISQIIVSLSLLVMQYSSSKVMQHQNAGDECPSNLKSSSKRVISKITTFVDLSPTRIAYVGIFILES